MLLAVGLLSCSKFLFSLTDYYLLGGARHHAFVLTQLPLIKDPSTEKPKLSSQACNQGTGQAALSPGGHAGDVHGPDAAQVRRSEAED